MIPVDFPQAFRTLGAPEGATNVTPLRIWTDGSEVISCWQFTEGDRAKVAAGEPIYLRSFSGLTMHPVCLEVGSPFRDAEELHEADAEVLRQAGIAP